jgi:phosphomevalonate kinase
LINDIANQLVKVLRKIDSKKCIIKATEIENEESPICHLNLRSLDLNSSNIVTIARLLKQNEDSNIIKSISFSYNKSLGDIGAIALSRNLSNNIQEIGLVNCGINDRGGIDLLNWINKSPKLKMICIERNNFSTQLKSEFKKFSNEKPNVLFVY